MMMISGVIYELSGPKYLLDFDGAMLEKFCVSLFSVTTGVFATVFSQENLRH